MQRENRKTSLIIFFPFWRAKTKTTCFSSLILCTWIWKWWLTRIKRQCNSVFWAKIESLLCCINLGVLLENNIKGELLSPARIQNSIRECSHHISRIPHSSKPLPLAVFHDVWNKYMNLAHPWFATRLPPAWHLQLLLGPKQHLQDSTLPGCGPQDFFCALVLGCI